jgi:hypothetical protein
MKRVSLFIIVFVICYGIYSPNANAMDERFCDQYIGVEKISWDGAELVNGQIGRLTVLKDTRLFSLQGEKKVESKILKQGEVYRIYAFKPGMLSVGGGFFVDRDDKVKYVTPSKTKLNAVKCIQEHKKNGSLTGLEIRLKNIIKEVIKPSMTDFEKIYYIHDFLVKQVEYDLDNYFKNTIPYDDYTAEGALFNGLAVCQGYAEATDLLLKEAGIESQIVVGSANGLGTGGGQEWGGHAWNLVKLNGKYYHLDTTWNDGGGSYNYFLVSGKKISSDHRFDATAYPKTDHQYDSVFSGKILLSKNNNGFFLLSTDSDDVYQITRVSNNGSVSHPYSHLKMNFSFEPIIHGNYLYYAKSNEDNFFDLHRVDDNGENDTVLLKGMEEPESYNNQYVYFIENELVSPEDYIWKGKIHRLSIKEGKSEIIYSTNDYLSGMYIDDRILYFNEGVEQKKVSL